MTLKKRLKEEAIIQGLIILLSTFTGLFLGYVVQQANSAIESAMNLHISQQGYGIFQKWLENHIVATYDLASQLLFSVLFGTILLAISTIILWLNRMLIVQVPIKHPAFWLLFLFLLSWIFQPVHSMMASWGTPSMGITQINASSVSASEILRIQSEIEKLKNFRFFGKQYMMSLLNTGLLFCIWFSSSKIYAINNTSHKQFIKKRAFSFLLITSISYAAYLCLSLSIKQIPLPSRLLSFELSMQVIVTYVTGEKSIFRLPGYNALKITESYFYLFLFGWAPAILWVICLIKNILFPYYKRNK